jgi:hypothetical protein
MPTVKLTEDFTARELQCPQGKTRAEYPDREKTIPQAADLTPSPSAAGSELTQDRDHAGALVMLVLHDGYSVSARLFDSVRQQVEEILPGVVRDHGFRLKDLCDREFWDRLNDGQRRMAGRCMAYMVVHGILPLRFADSKHEYPKRYQLK